MQGQEGGSRLTLTLLPLASPLPALPFSLKDTSLANLTFHQRGFESCSDPHFN